MIMIKIGIKLTWLLLGVVPLFGQSVPSRASEWVVEHRTDAFTNAEYTRYTLEGKYLAAPSDSSSTPYMVLKCKPQLNSGPGHKFDGKLLSAFLSVGNAVVDSYLNDNFVSKVVVQYRFDDGKIHTNYLYHTKDYSAISLQPPFCGACVINDFFYSHELAHKENTSPQNKKVVVSVPEYRGGDIVIQFDLPDVTEVAKSCGVTQHK